MGQYLSNWIRRYTSVDTSVDIQLYVSEHSARVRVTGIPCNLFPRDLNEIQHPSVVTPEVSAFGDLFLLKTPGRFSGHIRANLAR